MITEGKSTAGPDPASTIPATPSDIVGDRWTGNRLGKYQIIRRLGRGGMGVVYEARDPILERSVAIKVLREGIAAQPDAVRKFLREARTAAKLNHPHVVSVYDADQEKGIVFLIMELMEGGSAHDRIHKWGPFGWVEATKVLADACRGLAAVHETGLIHRDIKPSNVMRTKDETVKLTDFGLALTMTGSSDSNVANGQVVGTPHYMSPEQCRAQKLGPRSDIYALGATYYTLLTGLPPYDGKGAMEIMHGHCSRTIPDPCAQNTHIPAACADLIRRTMAKNPEHRPADASALIRDVEAILALATSPEFKALDWAPSSETQAPTLLPGIVSTAIEYVDPVYLTTRRTRVWLVVLCLFLMAAAFAVGRIIPLLRTDPRPVEPVADSGPPEQPKSGPAAAVNGAVSIDAGGRVKSLAFGPTETQIFWGTANGEQKISDWPTKGGLNVAVTEASRLSQFRQVAYWHAGVDPCWVTAYGNELHFLDKNDLKQKSVPDSLVKVGGKTILSFALHPKQKIIAIAVQDKGPSAHQGGIILRRLTGEPPYDDYLQFEDKSPPTCLAFSADGHYLLSGGGDGIARRWRIDSTTSPNIVVAADTASIRIGYGPIAAVAPLDKSHFAAALGAQVWICDARRGATVNLYDRSAAIKAAAIIVGGPAFLADARKSADDTDTKPFYAGSRPVESLVASRDGSRLACSSGNSVVIFDLATGLICNEFANYPGKVTAIAIESDAKWLAAGCEDGQIIIRRVW